MSEDLARDILLSDPLNEITRKERRNLLATSIIGIAIAKADLVPSKIIAFGIEFSQANQKSLMLVIGFVSLYFFLAFMFYAWSDFLIWLKKFNRERAKSVREKHELDRKMAGLLSPARRMEESIQSRKLIEETINVAFGISLLRYIWRPTFVLRALFDFALPIIVGGYACWILFTWTAPVPPNG